MAIHTDDSLISVREAALICGKNPETIRRWIWSGKLPAQKLGNQLFVKEVNLRPYCAAPASGSKKTIENAEEKPVQDDKAFQEYLDSVRLKPEEVDKLIEQWHLERFGNTEESFEKERKRVRDEIKKARAFRNKLRKRGLIFDASELIEEVREGLL